MKKLSLTFVILGTCINYCSAGVISHTDYVSGAAITAAGQNTNENAIFNEFNGNIDNTNIKTGGIQNANIAAGVISADRFVTIVQNVVQNISKYRRPNLSFVNTSTVTIETGLDGTSGDAVIMFPDGNVRTDTAAIRINCNFTLTAALSGAAQGGIRTGSVASSFWYAIYAVKTSDNSSNFVLVGDTLQPTQANYATLNTNFGVNGWVYLGMIRTKVSTTNIISFNQAGNRTIFTDLDSGGAFFNGAGLKLVTGSPVTSLTWAYATGTNGLVVPVNVVLNIYSFGSDTNAAVVTFRDNTSNQSICVRAQSAATGEIGRCEFPATAGALLQGSSGAMDIYLSGFADGALSQNSQL